MEKSRDAFRTISEVADLLETPAHVLRFWESRFPQVRPVKRAGGRRYYRPTDVALLSGIKQLLHRDGLTIRGVQKVLREQGIRHVMALADGQITVTEPDGLTAGAPGDEAVDPVPAAEPAAPRSNVLILGAVTPPPPAVDPLPLWTGIFDEEPVPDSEPAPAEAPLADAPDDDPADSETPEPARAGSDWLPARLRALSAADVAQNREVLAIVAGRLADLRARVAGASTGGGR